MRAYDLPNYDSWLNSNNPYDLADEEEQEREWLLEEIKEFDGDEEAIEDWLRREGYDDPRKS
jgi:plasmid maintenance system antidote protein VapI